MRIFFVRHGEVEDFYKGKYNGHNNISLSLNGKQQIKNLAIKLENYTFDKIFCSDLKRAKETLNMFSLDCDPIFTSALREKSWGRHEGLSYHEIVEQDSIEYKDFLQWINALDGESINDFQNRVQEYFVNEILKDKELDNILVITHAGVIKIILALIENISLEDAFTKKIEYGSYIVLEEEDFLYF